MRILCLPLPRLSSRFSVFRALNLRIHHRYHGEQAAVRRLSRSSQYPPYPLHDLCEHGSADDADLPGGSRIDRGDLRRADDRRHGQTRRSEITHGDVTRPAAILRAGNHQDPGETMYIMKPGVRDHESRAARSVEENGAAAIQSGQDYPLILLPTSCTQVTPTRPSHTDSAGPSAVNDISTSRSQQSVLAA